MVFLILALHSSLDLVRQSYSLTLLSALKIFLIHDKLEELKAFLILQMDLNEILT